MLKKNNRAILMNMGKGENTRQSILTTALRMAAAGGVNHLTIGQLAAATGMSKSGLFAHFKSKEALQLAVLGHAEDLFRESVITPVRQIPDPLDKLRQLVFHWLDWFEGYANTCIFMVAMSEFEDQPGPIRDFLLAQQCQWLAYLEHKVKAIVETGQFHKSTDPSLFVFRLQSLYLGTELYRWLSKENQRRNHFRQSFEILIEEHRV